MIQLGLIPPAPLSAAPPAPPTPPPSVQTQTPALNTGADVTEGEPRALPRVGTAQAPTFAKASAFS